MGSGHQNRQTPDLTRAYVNILNLNDSLLCYYLGVTDRPLQEEHYHWWLDFGAKFEF